jgi:uncharacterized protein YfiM (DUF2279 family)
MTSGRFLMEHLHRNGASKRFIQSPPDSRPQVAFESSPLLARVVTAIDTARLTSCWSFDWLSWDVTGEK